MSVYRRRWIQPRPRNAWIGTAGLVLFSLSGGASAAGVGGGARTVDIALTGGGSAACSGGGVRTVDYLSSGGGASACSGGGDVTLTFGTSKDGGGVATGIGGGDRLTPVGVSGGASSPGSAGGTRTVLVSLTGGGAATGIGGSSLAADKTGGGSADATGGSTRAVLVEKSGGGTGGATGGGSPAPPAEPVWIPPYEEDLYYSRLPYVVCQRALTMNVAPVGPPYYGRLGWFGTRFNPERGAVAVARVDSPFAGLVGERVRITYFHDPANPRTITVYVVDEAWPDEDLTIPRSMFIRLAPLAQDEVAVTVEVLA